MKKARIGFIGAGRFISANHLLTARDSRIMETAAIADLDRSLLDRHSAAMRVGYCTTDYRKVLADPDIDIAVIGTKQDLHAKMIVEALDAGKWVFCEKPMAETEEETAAVLAAEKRNPGRLAIGFNRRFAPAYLETRELMKRVPRPWFVNYRMMYPAPDKERPESFYGKLPQVLYEGCHVLDYVSFLLGEKPETLYMTGGEYRNNVCVLTYADGSQVSFMIGSLGSYCLGGKEYMEVFGKNAAITVSEFTDMRVRGLPGEFDRLYAPHLNEHADDVRRWGYDFYEIYKSVEMMRYAEFYKKTYGMDLELVRRPHATAPNTDEVKFEQQNPDLWSFQPDKGWVGSFEHFARAFLDGTEPLNADGAAGKLATDLAQGLLESLHTGRPTDFKG